MSKLILNLISEIKGRDSSFSITNKPLPPPFSIMLPYFRHVCDYQVTLNQQEYTSEDYVLCKVIFFMIVEER